MRCIEIPLTAQNIQTSHRLTLTWDVLKWDLLNCSRSALAD